MMAAYFTKDFIRFFEELEGNNNKPWFDSQKKRYEQEVKKPFERLVGDLIDQVQRFDRRIITTPKDAIFRINRDIRFSADKTPYKVMSSALLSPGGRKHTGVEGFYLEMSPAHVRVYCGAYAPDKTDLARIRSHLATHYPELERLIENPDFKAAFGAIRGDKNKILPPEWKEAGARVPLIYNKAFYYFSPLPNKVIYADGLVDVILEQYRIAMPVNQFFSDAIGKK